MNEGTIVTALRRTAASVKDELPLIALEEDCDDEPVGLLIEALERCLKLMLGFDSVTAHRLALDAVAEAYLADCDA